MNIKQAFILAIKNLLASKLRSILTMLGIIVGVSSVIILSTILDSFKGLLLGEISSFTNIIYVYGGVNDSQSSVGVSEKMINDIINERTDLFEESKLKISASISGAVTAGNRSVSATINGDSRTFIETYDVIKLLDGKVYNYIDEKDGNKKCLINDDLSKELFANENPIGKTITIENKNFEIIGVFTLTTKKLAGNENIVYVPVNSLNFNDITFEIEMNNEDNINKAVKVLNNKISDKGGFAYSANSEGEMDSIFKVINGIKYILIAIASISLIVGGIGIMNIMLVTVTERVKEIGIRKSLGAHPREILTQFIIEAITVSLVGGMIGVGIGIGVSLLILIILSTIIGLEFNLIVSTSSILIALSVSMAIGIIFGYFPAKKAAKLDPIDALRYE